MKIIEPVSSALLMTGCVYAAGVSQNSAFMRQFGVNPEFSQPSVDKILYDGGLVTFEMFYGHLKFISGCAALIVVVGLFVWMFLKYSGRGFGGGSFPRILAGGKQIIEHAPVGFLLLIYMVYLCFSSYQKSQEIGVKLSEVFMDNCHWVILKDKENSVKACAFRKDKDSIWYYNIKNKEVGVSSKLLTDVAQVTYLEPQKNPVPVPSGN